MGLAVGVGEMPGVLVGVVVGCWVGLAIGVSCAGNGSRMPNQAQAEMPMPSATIVKAQ